MERMKLERKNKNLKESLDIERRGHLQLARRVKQLEEENKKLKEEMKNRDKYRVEENKRLRKGIDIRLDSMGVKYIITEEGDYFTKSDFKITE